MAKKILGGNIIDETDPLDTKDTALATLVGEVQANPTANTVLARLKSLLTGIVLAAGSAIIGKVGIDQTTPGNTNGVNVNAVSAGTYSKNGLGSVCVTCTNADTDYVCGADIPSDAKLMIAGSQSAACVVAVGEATSSTVGGMVPPGGSLIPLKAADVAAGMRLHCQSATAGAICRFTYLAG